VDQFTFNLESTDAVYCLGRAFVLVILASSEAVLARRKRVGFERHLILFSASGILLGAEIFGVILACLEMLDPADPLLKFWVWYPILSTVGLLGLAFCFDYVRAAATHPPGPSADAAARRHARRFLIWVGLVLALGALVTSRPPHAGQAPTSVFHLDRAAYVLHGAQALAMLLLGWKALRARGLWLSRVEGRVIILGCGVGLLGAVCQMYQGPREFLTTAAFTMFVAVFLRDNYRRSELEAVRASEERTARTLLFHRITTQLKSTYDLAKLYEITMDSLLGNLGAESGAIYVAPKGSGALLPVLVHGPFPAPFLMSDATRARPREIRGAIEYTPVPLGVGVLGKVAASGVPLYLYDPEDVAVRYTWPTGGVEVHSTVALPLRSPEGINGVVQLVNRLDGQPFSEEDLRFMSLIVEQAGLAIYNARLHNEIVQQERNEEQLKIAHQIQIRLIPSELPSIPGISIGAEYRAAQEVGGDYFDFYRIDHDHLGIVVLDVAGKGVPGALLMAITGTLLKMATARSNSPAWVLNEVNAALSNEMRKGLYVTATYGVLRLSTLQFTMVSAGHPDVIVIRDRDLSCEKHKPRGAAIGLLKPNRFRAVMEQETIQLDVGDMLLLYTDGVIEAMNERGEQFGEERLCGTAKTFAREGARRTASEIVKAVVAHAGATPQYDDITLVALRIAPEDEDGAAPGPP
jgi:sigma-B regulation protein RsbU (phosphoserine phosphatase)